jgi:hypothetical protein
MDLPTDHISALRWYERIEKMAATPEMWRQAQAWLGRNDLFFLLVKLLRRADLNKPWLFARCREVQAKPNGCLDLWAREHGKDLATTTPVFTANRGWVVHGDLIPGDLVFSPDGSHKLVLAVTEHYTNHACYSLTFGDGARIIAGSGHLWRLHKKSKPRVPMTYREGHFRTVAVTDEIVTTQEMFDRRGQRLDVGVCAPLQFPEVALPLDPYVLGVWLGDGDTNGVRVTAGHRDAEWMQSALSTCGVEVNNTRHSNAVTLRLGTGRRGDRSSSDVANVLRRLNVMGNKHIPLAYMRGSVAQRMALLQGLMDTDGTCNTRGTATFAQAKPALARQVYDLAVSLGLKPQIARRIGRYKGGNIFWQISFQAHQDRNPFRMPRKAARAIPASHYRGVRTVTNIESVPSVPTNCITVEGGLYCAGYEMVPTHNSSIITFGMTIFDILNDPEITVGIFSHTRPIAKTFLRQIKIEFETNDWLKHLYPDVLYEHPHRESAKWSEDDGIIVRRKGNPKEGTVEAWGLVDGQPTGRHFRLRVYDDVVTRESVTTPEQITKTTLAWELSDNLGVQSEYGGVARHIGTRYSLYDTYSAMLSRKAVTPRIYAATHNGRFDGRPVLFTTTEWERRCTTQSRPTIASQLLQNPMADDSAMFRTIWLKAYEVRPRTMNVYIMCDPSRGKSASSDNTAIAVVGVAQGGAKYLLDGFCHKMTLSQRWLALRGMYRRWSAMPGVQHVEVGYERYGAQSDDEYFQEQMELEHRRKVPNAHFMIQELNWPREGGNSKRERIERLEPDFRNGRFFLPLPIVHDGKPKTWRVDTDPASHEFGEVEFSEARGLTRQQMQAIEGGSSELVAKAIVCRDPSLPGPRDTGGRYDLTVRMIEDFKVFPFGAHDDLLDATSRIYDMDPSPPIAPSARRQVVNVFVDGV